MKTIVVIAALFIVPLFSGCTQWGTSLFAGNSDAGVWWACPDRHERCGDAALQLIQMDNTCRSAQRDFTNVRVVDLANAQKMIRLFEALLLASAARSEVKVRQATTSTGQPLPSYEVTWDDALADYTLACVRAERAALALLPRKASVYP